MRLKFSLVEKQPYVGRNWHAVTLDDIKWNTIKHYNAYTEQGNRFY